MWTHNKIDLGKANGNTFQKYPKGMKSLSKHLSLQRAWILRDNLVALEFKGILWTFNKYEDCSKWTKNEEDMMFVSNVQFGKVSIWS